MANISINSVEVLQTGGTDSVSTLVDQSFREIKKRPFDRFVLGPFLIWYAVKSKSMKRTPRTILLSAGIYNILYNRDEYKALFTALKNADYKLAAETVLNKEMNV